HQDRDGIEISDDLGRRRERHGGNKDGAGRVTITAKPQRFEREVKSRRGRVESNRVAGANGGPERFLEPLDPWSRRQPARPENLEDFGFFVGPDFRPKKWNVQVAPLPDGARTGAPVCSLCRQ